MDAAQFSSDNAQVDPQTQTDIANLERKVREFQSESKYIEAIGILENLLKIKKKVLAWLGLSTRRRRGVLWR